ncbi:MAG: helix-turn-helix transcriptional regulator [Gammaproteobacteria bacterium]
MTLWRWCREKRFPQPVRLAANTTRWPRAAVEQWETERAAGPKKPKRRGVSGVTQQPQAEG